MKTNRRQKDKSKTYDLFSEINNNEILTQIDEIQSKYEPIQEITQTEEMQYFKEIGELFETQIYIKTKRQQHYSKY